MRAFLYREREKLFYLVFISLPKRHTRGKICLEHHQRVWLAVEDLHSQMENNFWELSTSKETFLRLEQGNHFAKLPGAASGPPAVDVCPAVIYHRHTEAEWDPVLPGAWRVEGTRCGTVQVKQMCTAEFLAQDQRRGWGTIQLPSSTTSAALGWGSVRNEDATGS